MPFLFIFLFIIATQTFFSYSFFSQEALIYNVFGAVQLVAFVGTIVLMFFFFRRRNSTNYKAGFYSFGAMIASGVPAIAFIFPGILKLITGNILFFQIGWTLSFLLFVAILVGILWGRWNWKVHKVQLDFPHFPEDLNSVKILQISDVHVGSFFNNYKKVEKAIEKINTLNADYVFFTGDLVNNSAAEMKGWESVFSKIQAKKGKYSILGNHDYGDYVKWESEDQKHQNLRDLIAIHQEIGFQPLLNESVELAPNFWLLGVENWGKAPFRQSGELGKTLSNVPAEAFKLLLSHDPSHFDLQVLDTDIDLTLSGHTHGMQFGIERFGIKFSPVSLRYKKWAGLYQVGKQYLYVNRGFGYLGFPGRVGIYPEITEITLERK
jgi:predicted MPP superfamily phosphohydrolase